MSNRMRNAVIATTLVVAGLAIYLLRLNQTAGLMVDDAWYVLFAKALAEGRGYRMISSSVEPMVPIYPPGYPALLSLAFWIMPRFPENVGLLKAVSIASMCGVGLLTFVYLRRDRGQSPTLAGLSALTVTLTPAFVFLATSTVMSECTFTLWQLATVVLLHRSVAPAYTSRKDHFAGAAAVTAAIAILTRSTGVSVMMAGAIWLAKERGWRRASVFVLWVTVCVLPWMLYARTHTASAEQRAAHGGAVVYTYTDQLSMKWAGSPSFGRITAKELPARVMTNLLDVFGRDVGGILVPVLFRGATESGEEVVALGGFAGLMAAGMGGATQTVILSILLSAVALVGYVRHVRERVTIAELLVPLSLGITLIWPFWSFRFVLPLTPFLLLYFSSGVQLLARGSVRVTRIVVLCLVGLHLSDHATYIALAHGRHGSAARIQWLRDAHAVEEALKWMEAGFVRQGTVATTNPALVYLRTGRKGIAFDDRGTPVAVFRARGVRYIATLIPMDLPHSSWGTYHVRFLQDGLWVIELP